MKRLLPLVMLAVLVAGGLLWWSFDRVFVSTRPTDAGQCNTVRGECDSLTPETISKISGMELPPGTVIEESSYQSFQDWQMTARFLVPADQVQRWEGSAAAYGVATAKNCAGSPSAGAARRCTEQTSHNGEFRSYIREDLPDGSVRINVSVFTT